MSHHRVELCDSILDNLPSISRLLACTPTKTFARDIDESLSIDIKVLIIGLALETEITEIEIRIAFEVFRYNLHYLTNCLFDAFLVTVNSLGVDEWKNKGVA